jgi:hypothetical protein
MANRRGARPSRPAPILLVSTGTRKRLRHTSRWLATRSGAHTPGGSGSTSAATDAASHLLSWTGRAVSRLRPTRPRFSSGTTPSPPAQASTPSSRGGCARGPQRVTPSPTGLVEQRDIVELLERSRPSRAGAPRRPSGSSARRADLPPGVASSHPRGPAALVACATGEARIRPPGRARLFRECDGNDERAGAAPMHTTEGEPAAGLTLEGSQLVSCRWAGAALSCSSPRRIGARA